MRKRRQKKKVLTRRAFLAFKRKLKAVKGPRLSDWSELPEEKLVITGETIRFFK